ncbi:hypothetical protein A2955_01055 [Candidatus Woesebacteria bacterium RIFCSPLOWO2_01_FULL_37_19]|uniref:Solute-binding protein family 5 domain-containing protein n=2 Tax=Candidatus Woeseibacteriota TaxID=1752722 RepID=A0A1F8AY40_9BACT|nr:MAG: hypothetical protein A2771_00690 [Candidatus Woesebacteria bacterium RIFCSPHIGHO2_01_FULL_38_26b]OGM56550.1 MAG: hypothetical protein A2955_01055 [Candidatus Woesebacteria bacterium RIFCSPLOWO2_01_FULL_37_19]
MVNFRYLYRLITAYLKHFKGLLLIGVIFGILFFFILLYLIPNYWEGSTQRIGLSGRYHPNEMPEFILSEISSGLTSSDESGNVIPNIAKSWDTPDKGKTWIFHINESLKWHDESKLISSDLKYEFSDVSVEYPDAYTILFKLKDVFIPFPSVVSKPVFKKGLLGIGEWKVKKLTQNAGYVQELIVTKGNSKKIYKFYPTSDRTKLSFKLGEVDSLYEVLDPSPFTTWKTVNTKERINKNQIVTLFFNTQDKHFGEKNFRQALTYAINKDLLGERSISPISPNSWVYNPQVKKYEYDKERAKELIKEFPKEFLTDLEVQLITSPALLPIAELISKDWNDVGVINTVLVSSILPSEFQVFLTIYDVPKDPDQYSIWHSTQLSTNLSKYTNPRIDKLLEDGRKTLDIEERKAGYLDFQRFLVEDLPAAFLIHPKYWEIKRK